MNVPTAALSYLTAPDEVLVARSRSGDGEAFRALMQRCNQRLFRMARSIVRTDADAEDVLQEAYVRAYGALDGFRGEAGVLTWLTRIVINEARGRLRKRRTLVGLEAVEAAQENGQIVTFPLGAAAEDPEKEVARAEMRRLIERAVDQLAEPFRVVFILRDVEGCSLEETSGMLGIRPATVKTRLHRARRQLRERLQAELGSVLGEAFPFLGARCERITEAVIRRLGLTAGVGLGA